MKSNHPVCLILFSKQQKKYGGLKWRQWYVIFTSPSMYENISRTLSFKAKCSYLPHLHQSSSYKIKKPYYLAKKTLLICQLDINELYLTETKHQLGDKTTTLLRQHLPTHYPKYHYYYLANSQIFFAKYNHNHIINDLIIVHYTSLVFSWSNSSISYFGFLLPHIICRFE